MFKRKYNVIHCMVQEGRYVMTHHALDEMIADDLHIQDIEHIILNGKIIRVEREKENMEQKYVIYGETRDNFAAEVIVKVKGQKVKLSLLRSICYERNKLSNMW